jgi:poly [ADP-ribose] polymerase
MRKVYLIYIDGINKNSNKYYNMFENEDNQTFNVEYGRVGQSKVLEEYVPMGKWKSKYNEKIRKGYKDITEYKVIQKAGQLTFPDNLTEKLFTTLSHYSQTVIGKTFVSSELVITKLMIDDGNNFLSLMKDAYESKELETFNKYFVNLLSIFPRKINNVKDLLPKTTDNLIEIISKEKDNLDALSTQMITNVATDGSLSDLLSCDIRVADKQDISKFEHLFANNSIKGVFKVGNSHTDNRLNNWLEKQSNKSVEYLLHGTRNENVFPILKGGLITNPTDVVISGKIYGNGIYHSTHFAKSLGYTSSSLDRIMLVQCVHMGNPYNYRGWYREGKDLKKSQMNYNYLKSIGYDSLYVSPGDGLRNSEYIVYNQDQTTTQYLLWI